MLTIEKVYLLHDYLYFTKNETNKYSDGKDKVTICYVIVDEHEKSQLLSNGLSSEGIILYSTLKDAQEEYELLIK